METENLDKMLSLETFLVNMNTSITNKLDNKILSVEQEIVNLKFMALSMLHALRWLKVTSQVSLILRVKHSK